MNTNKWDIYFLCPFCFFSDTTARGVISKFTLLLDYPNCIGFPTRKHLQQSSSITDEDSESKRATHPSFCVCTAVATTRIFRALILYPWVIHGSIFWIFGLVVFLQNFRTCYLHLFQVMGDQLQSHIIFLSIWSEWVFTGCCDDFRSC